VELKLLTPNSQVFSGEAELIGGRTESGSFSILTRHIPAVMELESAALKVEGPEGVKKFVVHGGFLFKERDETVRVLTREAVDFEQIDPPELEARIDELERELEEMSEEKGADYEKARMELDRAKFSLSLIENG